jgi:hypothetical protein
MKPEPKPKTELVATRFEDSEIITLTPNSSDAREFVLEKASLFGYVEHLVGNKYVLFVRPGYDAQEVLGYFQSYND